MSRANSQHHEAEISLMQNTLKDRLVIFNSEIANLVDQTVFVFGRFCFVSQFKEPWHKSGGDHFGSRFRFTCCGTLFRFLICSGHLLSEDVAFDIDLGTFHFLFWPYCLFDLLCIRYSNPEIKKQVQPFCSWWASYTYKSSWQPWTITETKEISKIHCCFRWRPFSSTLILQNLHLQHTAKDGHQQSRISLLFMVQVLCKMLHQHHLFPLKMLYIIQTKAQHAPNLQLELYHRYFEPSLYQLCDAADIITDQLHLHLQLRLLKLHPQTIISHPHRQFHLQGSSCWGQGTHSGTCYHQTS